MKYIDPRFVVLIFGYVLLSEFLSLWTDTSFARGLSALVLMLIIYWFPSRLKIDLLNWMGGSFLTAILIYLVNADFSIAFTVMLVTIFLLSYFKK